MSRFILASVILSTLLLPGLSHAKKQKVWLIQPLIDELVQKGGDAEALSKTLRPVERCYKGDRAWDIAQFNELTPNQIYELMLSSVTCWQMAGKKMAKAGEPVAPILPWITVRTKYVEAFKQYMWALDAKVAGGDSAVVCRRLTGAVKAAAAVQEVAIGLIDKYETNGAKTLAAVADQNAKDIGRFSSEEYENQRCK